MALIDCPECGVAVSSNAIACPSCAYPVAADLVTGRAAAAARDRGGAGRPAKAVWDATKQIAGRIVLGGVFLVAGASRTPEPVVLGSMVVFASCIPIWWRARRLARGIGEGAGDPAAVERRVSSFLADAEERQSRQLAMIEDHHAGRLAELEERLDFTERLLVKYKEHAPPSGERG